MEVEKFSYDNKIVRAFMIATVVFGLVGMLVGLTAAIQLFYPLFNFDLQNKTKQSLIQLCRMPRDVIYTFKNKSPWHAGWLADHF